MAGEEFWRANNNGIVAPKIWERKFGKIKFVKRLTIFHLPFNIDHIVWKWEDLCISEMSGISTMG